MEGQDETDGAPGHHPTPQPAHPMSSQDASPRASSFPEASVTHNGRLDAQNPTPLCHLHDMDSVEMGLDPDSLAEDCETTASSATTVVCDSRFFCATPDNPDNTQLDSLDHDSGPEDTDNLPVTPCRSLTPSPSGSSATEPCPSGPSSNGPSQPGPSPNGPSGPSVTYTNVENPASEHQPSTRTSPPSAGDCAAPTHEPGSLAALLAAPYVEGEGFFPIINTGELLTPFPSAIQS